VSLNWTTYVAQTSNLMVIGSTDANFQTMLPGMIDYAEQRLYRELDPLYSQVTDNTATCSSGNRNFTPPTSIGTFITVDSVSIITPVTATSSNGTRVQLTPVSPEVVDALWPSGQTATGVPSLYAMRSPTTVLLGPAPDAAYATEVIGIQRPASLSSANSSTFLTQYCPDLMIAASMVFAFGYMRDFGGQSDNPQGGASWEAQYKSLFQSAAMEQARAKWEADGWTSQSPAPAGKRT
jgi:hypothetical protein